MERQDEPVNHRELVRIEVKLDQIAHEQRAGQGLMTTALHGLERQIDGLIARLDAHEIRISAVEKEKRSLKEPLLLVSIPSTLIGLALLLSQMLARLFS